jgi:hypothetical protein
MKQEILTYGNAFAPFYITEMTSLHERMDMLTVQ